MSDSKSNNGTLSCFLPDPPAADDPPEAWAPARAEEQ